MLKDSIQNLVFRHRGNPGWIAEVAEQVQHRYEQTESRLNAYKTWMPDFFTRPSAGGEQGALLGVPVSVKDLYGVNGVPVYAGTPRALPEKWQREGPVVQRLKQQGAIICGKTHTVEMAFGGLGVNNHWGTPRNPWDSREHRVPGGSSCGAGVSLVQGTALLALGTDTAGSVRIPASMTGTVGLKTTVGRWPTAGIVPLSPTLDTAGMLTRTVEDAIYAFAVLDPSWNGDTAGLLARARQYRVKDVSIGIDEPLLHDHCDPDILQCVECAYEELSAAGIALCMAALPEAAEAFELLQIGNVVSAECDEFMQHELAAWLPLLDPLVMARIQDGVTISAREYLSRRRRLQALARRASDRFERYDVIACPTVPLQPPRLAEVTNLDGYRPKNMASLRNTCVASSLGLCAISLPAGLDRDHLPVGLQLMAPAGQEEMLLAVALLVENIIGQSQRRRGPAPEVPS